MCIRDSIHTMLERGSSTDRQLAVWRANGENLNAVVDDLIAETEKLG